MSGFSGMKAWLIQRFSGIYIGLFVLIFSFVFWQSAPFKYHQWVGLFSQTWIQITTSLFILALLFHAWIGLRDIFLDYIHSISVKMVVMSAIILMLLASGFWGLRALFLVEMS
jgi:succinate dehydrogenase / fumarate reductase membrane anchor subunit